MRSHHDDHPLILGLKSILKGSVLCLAILATVAVLWAVFQAGRTVVGGIAGELGTNPVDRMMDAIMLTLIAIEVFENVEVYLREQELHLKIVLGTALMGVARKFIVIDSSFKPEKMAALSGVIVAIAIAWYLVHKIHKPKKHDEHHHDPHPVKEPVDAERPRL